MSCWHLADLNVVGLDDGLLVGVTVGHAVAGLELRLLPRITVRPASGEP